VVARAYLSSDIVATDAIRRATWAVVGPLRVFERTHAANRLHAHLVIIEPGAAAQIRNVRAARHLAAARRLIARSRGTRAELAQREWARVRALRPPPGRPARDARTAR
jgi:hypothetical protein